MHTPSRKCMAPKELDAISPTGMREDYRCGGRVGANSCVFGVAGGKIVGENICI